MTLEGGFPVRRYGEINSPVCCSGTLLIPPDGGMEERRNRKLQIDFIFVFTPRIHGNNPFFSGDVEFIIAIKTVP